MKIFFEPTDILSALQGFNPWWRRRTHPTPDFRRDAFQTVREHLAGASELRAVLLTGPRRAGKTTILRQIAADLVADGQDPKSILYLDLDHPLLKLVPLRDILKRYHEVWHPEAQPATLLLDEVQHADQWEAELKRLTRSRYRILAAASAAAMDRLAESDPGRWTAVALPTLSFYEFARIREEPAPDVEHELQSLFDMKPRELTALAKQTASLQPLFQRYLLVGGFPETARGDDVAFCQEQLRTDVLEQVLKRDVVALSSVRKTDDLERLFVYLCLRAGDILFRNTCAADLGISAVTVSSHLELLERINLIYRLPPSRLDGKKLRKARNKYYLVDAALRNAVLLRGEEMLSDARQLGMIVETAVLRHLHASRGYDVEFTYWRDPATGKDVDIIARDRAGALPFEIDYRADAGLDRRGGLAAWCRATKARKAYLVTKRDEDFGVSKIDGVPTSFLSIPAHIFCYLAR